MDSEIRLLLKILDQAYEKKAWHGPNLRGSLRGVTAEEAAWRPGPGRHNIWEIALHAAYWKYAVRRRLLGEKRGSFPVRGSNWFRRESGTSGVSWSDDVRLLADQHRTLRRAISGLRAADLGKKSRGSTQETATLIYGIASHDLYHAGQIQLLKRLYRSR